MRHERLIDHVHGGAGALLQLSAALKDSQVSASLLPPEAPRHDDVRASFVTVALATGKSETSVRDRTGHTTGLMLERYRRQARHATELGLQWFKRLDLALNGGHDHGHDHGHEGTDEGQETSGNGNENASKEARCTRGELNPYAFRRRNLNPVRMPISPLVRRDGD